MLYGSIIITLPYTKSVLYGNVTIYQLSYNKLLLYILRIGYIIISRIKLCMYIFTMYDTIV